ncbi:MAG: hypothetical protein H0V40_06535 [Actinobacteria bacterium]|nr:hypothetical protein [Actinomycetota bacterium]
MIQVVLRLSDGDRIETGAFRDEAEAKAHAEELIGTLDTMQPWPRVGDRYLRPGSIVSVDLAEVRDTRWSGSEARLTWASARDDPSPS